MKVSYLTMVFATGPLHLGEMRSRNRCILSENPIDRSGEFLSRDLTRHKHDRRRPEAPVHYVSDCSGGKIGSRNRDRWPWCLDELGLLA